MDDPSNEERKCVYCGVEFEKQASLRKHLRMAYHWPPIAERGLQASKTTHSSNLSNSSQTSKPERLVRANDSMRKDADESTFVILVGSKSKSNSNRSNFNKTCEKVQEKLFTCSHCEKPFLRKPDLVRHIRTHTGERPFACTYCDATFIKASSLRCHLRKHTGERPYKCEHCSATFKDRGNAKTHLRTHTGEKPFVCEECGAKFSRRHHLNIHSSVHTGIKPFRCAVCGTSFAGKAQLQVHSKIHTGEKTHSCAYCGATFSHTYDVKKHILRCHTGITSHPDGKRRKSPKCKIVLKKT